jgi:splicing factor 3B subunit 1
MQGSTIVIHHATLLSPCLTLSSSLFFSDLVHRQTACAAIKHMALGVYGFGCEDALTHLMNFVWPNVFETSPHLVQAFMDAVDGMRVSLGPMKVLSYVVQVRGVHIGK